jgi:hypothetical protein
MQTTARTKGSVAVRTGSLAVVGRSGQRWGSLRQTHPAQQVGVARVGADVVESGINV